MSHFDLPPDANAIAAMMRRTIEEDRAYAAWADRLDAGILRMSRHAEERRAAELALIRRNVAGLPRLR
jgi:hypothetical protein